MIQISTYVPEQRKDEQVQYWINGAQRCRVYRIKFIESFTVIFAVIVRNSHIFMQNQGCQIFYTFSNTFDMT